MGPRLITVGGGPGLLLLTGWGIRWFVTDGQVFPEFATWGGSDYGAAASVVAGCGASTPASGTRIRRLRTTPSTATAKG